MENPINTQMNTVNQTTANFYTRENFRTSDENLKGVLNGSEVTQQPAPEQLLRTLAAVNSFIPRHI